MPPPQVVLKGDQPYVIDSLVKNLCQYLPLTELASKGFFTDALLEWQTQHKLEAGAIRLMSNEERIVEMEEILNIVYARLTAEMKNKKSAQVIAQSVRHVLEFYIDSYADRECFI